MEDNATDIQQGPCDPIASRTYSGAEALLHNLPYIVMTALGATVLFRSFQRPAWAYVTATGYVFYGFLGAVWIMVFVCPFCRFWDTNACPCGYGKIAAKIRKRQSEDQFSEKFKKHIPVIVPLWFLPLLAAVPALIRGFTWGYVILVVAFMVDAFVILPLLSTQHGCRDCPQRQTCPWMKRKDAA